MTALAWIGLGAIIVAAVWVIADEAVDDMLARAQFDLAEADAEWDALMDEIDDDTAAEHRMRLEDHLRHLGLIDPDPFVDLRAEIAALETTEDFR